MNQSRDEDRAAFTLTNELVGNLYPVIVNRNVFGPVYEECTAFVFSNALEDSAIIFVTTRTMETEPKVSAAVLTQCGTCRN